MGNILVLGANGFIGSYLVEKLLQNHHVVGYSRHSPSAFLSNPCYTHVNGDFVTEQNFAVILKRYEISCVYHCISTTTPQEGTKHVVQEVEENVLPTLRLLEASANRGVERIIFTSSGGTVYGEGLKDFPHQESDRLEPICSYGVQKLSIEGYLRLYRHMRGLNTISVRISNPYGLCLQSNRMQGIIPILLRRLKQGEKITLFGDTVRDYIYIDDVIRALVALLDYHGEESVFNVGSGTGIHLSQLVKQIEAISELTFSNIDRQSTRSCDLLWNVLDISAAERELGWHPEFSLEEGIRETILRMKQVGA